VRDLTREWRRTWLPYPKITLSLMSPYCFNLASRHTLLGLVAARQPAIIGDRLLFDRLRIMPTEPLPSSSIHAAHIIGE